jgi:hypothetical protein
MNARCKIVNRGITTFAVVLGLTTASGPLLLKDAKAASTEIHQVDYNPEACKTDAQGKVYIAIGRNVFAFATTGTYIVAQYGNTLPKPPDPADEVGCPGNPAQLSDYSFPYAYDTSTEKKSGRFSNLPQADVLRLISLGDNPEFLLADDLDQPTAKFEVKRAPSGCTIREQLPSGFIACRMKQASAQDMQAIYIARADTYQTPLGQPFVVNCSDQTDKIPAGQCSVDYMFAPGLGVNYQFHTAQDSKALPIDQVIAFDRGLRAAINATLVKNYRWAD